jgi:hypothetical protein
MIVKRMDALVKNKVAEVSTEAVVGSTIVIYKDMPKTVRQTNNNIPNLPCLYNGFMFCVFLF